MKRPTRTWTIRLAAMATLFAVGLPAILAADEALPPGEKYYQLMLTEIEAFDKAGTPFPAELYKAELEACRPDLGLIASLRLPDSASHLDQLHQWEQFIEKHPATLISSDVSTSVAKRYDAMARGTRNQAVKNLDKTLLQNAQAPGISAFAARRLLLLSEVADMAQYPQRREEFEHCLKQFTDVELQATAYGYLARFEQKHGHYAKALQASLRSVELTDELWRTRPPTPQVQHTALLKKMDLAQELMEVRWYKEAAALLSHADKDIPAGTLLPEEKQRLAALKAEAAGDR